MKELGVDLDSMAYIMGHKDATMLSRVYGKSDARARLSALKTTRARLQIA